MAAVISLSLCSCVSVSIEYDTSSTSDSSSSSERGYPEYYHYDAAEFYEKCDELKSLAETGPSEDINTLYDELYPTLAEISDLNSSIYI